MTNYLKVNVDTFGFVNREKKDSGVSVKYRCGRDFIYYVLHYYYPDEFNPKRNNALQLEQLHTLGLSLPWWLMWTQLQFIYLPRLLKKLGLQLNINGRIIESFLDLFKAISIPKQLNVDEQIRKAESSIDAGSATGIDISLGLHGLVDHLLFVYGYDESNFYVFDTHKVPKLEYEKLTQDNRFYMKLPKSVIRKRWSRFGRVWIIKRLGGQ